LWEYLGDYRIIHGVSYVYPDPPRCSDVIGRWSAGAVVRVSGE